MKVTKIICDVCGKETKQVDRYTFPVNHIYNSIGISCVTDTVLEVCPNCRIKIADCLQENFGVVNS